LGRLSSLLRTLYAVIVPVKPLLGFLKVEMLLRALLLVSLFLLTMILVIVILESSIDGLLFDSIYFRQLKQLKMIGLLTSQI